MNVPGWLPALLLSACLRSPRLFYHVIPVKQEHGTVCRTQHIHPPTEFTRVAVTATACT